MMWYNDNIIETKDYSFVVINKMNDNSKRYLHVKPPENSKQFVKLLDSYSSAD